MGVREGGQGLSSGWKMPRSSESRAGVRGPAAGPPMVSLSLTTTDRKPKRRGEGKSWHSAMENPQTALPAPSQVQQWRLESGWWAFVVCHWEDGVPPLGDLAFRWRVTVNPPSRPHGFGKKKGVEVPFQP